MPIQTRQLAAAMFFAVFAAGCSSEPQAPQAAAQPVQASAADPGEAMTCDTDTDIGTHIAKKTCVSASVAEQRKAQAQEYLERAQQAAKPNGY